jgi:signal transduction histidine kinase
MRESLSADHPLQENVRRLQQSCDRLNSVITSGLSFIRPMEYKMQPVRIEKLLQRLLNTTWQQRLHKHQVRAEFNPAPRLPMIEGDERALDHLLTNLFDNAVDAMSTNPPEAPRVLGISIQAIPAPNRQTVIEVRISDTGPGISENIREKIFEPFYTTKSNGTGVGLSLVKRITTAHRGLVKVDSFTGGTIFSLQIPAITTHAILIEEVNE